VPDAGHGSAAPKPKRPSATAFRRLDELIPLFPYSPRDEMIALFPRERTWFAPCEVSQTFYRINPAADRP